MMRRVAPVTAALLLFAAGCGGEHVGGPQRVGALTVDFQADPKPPHEGLDSNFDVLLTGPPQEISGATVHVQLTYVSLGTQTGPAADAQEKSPGRYETGPLVTGKAGNWVAEVTIRPNQGNPATLKFPFAVVH